jgi:hypothetical protein
VGVAGIGRRLLTQRAHTAVLGSRGLVALGFLLQLIGQFHWTLRLDDLARPLIFGPVGNVTRPCDDIAWLVLFPVPALQQLRQRPFQDVRKLRPGLVAVKAGHAGGSIVMVRNRS